MFRLFFTVIFLSLISSIHSQDFSTEEQHEIDSLNLLLNNPNSPDTSVANAYVILADILYYQNMDTVIPLCEKANRLITQSLKTDPIYAIEHHLLRSRIEAYKFIAYVHVDNENYNAGLKYYSKIKKITNQLNDKIGLASYHSGMGEIYYMQDNLIAALDHYHKALKINKTLGDQIEIAGCLTDVGHIYVGQEDYKTALEYYYKAIKIREKLGNKKSQLIAFEAVGVVLMRTGKYKEAIKYYNKALEIALPQGNKARLSSTYHGIGMLYKRLKDYNKAIENFNYALKYGEDDPVTLSELSNAYLVLGDLTKAKSLATRAFSIAKESEIPSFIYGGSRALSNVEAKLGNHKRALELYKLHILMKDSMSNRRTIAATARRQVEYEFEKEETKLIAEKAKAETDLNLSNEKVKTRSYMLGGISLFSLSVIVLTFFIYRKKKKEEQLNKILVASNEMVLAQKEALEKNVGELEKTVAGQKPEDDFYYFTQSAIKVKFADIILLETSAHYVLINVVGRKHPLLERLKMDDLLNEFPTTVFAKIHRSYSVNLEHIVSRPSKYVVKMSNGVVLNASRSYVENLGDKFL